MPDLVIASIEPAFLEELRQRASSHGRTPEAEAKLILHAALQRPSQGIWAQVNEIRDGLAASGRSFSDSTELLREDRER